MNLLCFKFESAKKNLPYGKTGFAVIINNIPVWLGPALSLKMLILLFLMIWPNCKYLLPALQWVSNLG